jgi:hypothetical protein
MKTIKYFISHKDVLKLFIKKRELKFLYNIDVNE